MLEARTRPQLHTLPGTADPLDVLRAWRPDRPLVMMHSGRPHERWARWSVLACPAGWYRFEEGVGATITGDLPGAENLARVGDDPLDHLDVLLEFTPAAPAEETSAPPFQGGWIGVFGYELGRHIEPTAAVRTNLVHDRKWPLLALAWCPNALMHDNRTGQWFAVGDSVPEDWPPPGVTDRTGPPGLSAGQEPLDTSMPQREYEASVQRVIDYIGAGDAFQVNLTQRLTTPWSGSPRELAARAMSRSAAWYGAYLELPDNGGCVVSMSPELFLQLDPGTRQVVTRPIKGTRPSHVATRELLESAKDAAELHMIIDLMRNDLGRVCEFGTVRVPAGRVIESHPTVHHGVGEVTGRLRPGITTGDLLRATFPPGSVTGAPKIRAMQIIEELEPVARGPYCGAVGAISRSGHLTLNVAIRTLLLSGDHDQINGQFSGHLDYGAGGGIVADSIPRAEYEESLAKAEILKRVLEPG